MNLKRLSILVVLAASLLMVAEGCRSKGTYGTHRRGGGGCDCPHVGR